MIHWLMRLLGLHVHDWNAWETTHTFVGESCGVVKTVQRRTCKTCGYADIRERRV